MHEQINRMDWLAKTLELDYFVETPITYDRNIASNTQLYLPICNAYRESDANFTSQSIYVSSCMVTFEYEMYTRLLCFDEIN